MRKKQIINSFITIENYQGFLFLINSISKHKSSYIVITNVHMVIEAYLDKKFQKVVNNADIATPDGAPIAKAIKYIYGIDQDRVAGMDLMPDLIKYCGESCKKIFLYGSTNDILEKIKSKAKKAYPCLQIKSYSPPFRELNEDEKKEVIKMINDYHPDFVFVALGCPKQEKWMAEHKDKINSCMIGLGGAFEVYAEVKTRAPEWMQRHSLEWLYRLLQDPKRLWKRYLVTNTLFLILICYQFTKEKILKVNVK